MATMAGGVGSNIGRANIIGLGGKNAGGGMRTGPTTPNRQPKAARMEGVGYRLSDGRPFAGSLLLSVPLRKYGKVDRGETCKDRIGGVQE